MANDLATLNPKLETMLRDTTNAVWASAELDDILTWSLARMYPHLARILDPTSTTVTLSPTTYHYALPTGVMDVSRVDLVVDTEEYGPIPGGSWEIVGDPILGTGKIHVAPAIVDSSTNGTLRLHGYGRFEFAASKYLPDDYVPLLLAMARAEAYRRVAGDRQKFETWLARNQTQNVTVTELINLVNEADREAEMLWRRYRTWRKPVPGRVG